GQKAYHSSERDCHNERNAHHADGEDVERSLVALNRTGKEKSQRQSQRHLHVGREMMPVVKRPEGNTLRQLFQPVNFVRACEGLYETEDSKQETEDGYNAHDEPQSFRAINEGERGGKVD